MIDIIASQQFPKILMLSHPNSSKFPPKSPISHVSIVQIVSVVPRSMAEETDDLL